MLAATIDFAMKIKENPIMKIHWFFFFIEIPASDTQYRSIMKFMHSHVIRIRLSYKQNNECFNHIQIQTEEILNEI